VIPTGLPCSKRVVFRVKSETEETMSRYARRRPEEPLDAVKTYLPGIENEHELMTEAVKPISRIVLNVFDPENEGNNTTDELSSVPQGSPCTDSMKPAGCSADGDIIKVTLTKSPATADAGVMVNTEISVTGDANTTAEKFDDAECRL